ncbi:PREDICTED: arylacetamide deacetylase [Corvus brachyrhynchos]|uniref:arylacetamide deacetylase n=1 Tax=Corvus brachyrhynchos TaxID=85066 RepID=UPI0008166526|nr:PREDICTED: arylacetamide deacetylase [Corvus brachyrhynchos]
MGARLLCLCLLTALLGYYIYTPLPEDLAEPWKVMLVSAAFRAVGHLSEAADLLGLMHYMDGMRLITVLELVSPSPDENVTVTDTKFNNVPVRLYLPRRAPDGLRRAMVYFHGGGWCLGDAGMKSYDHISRQISNELNAVVVSVNYRLAPQHHFPVQFEDVYSVTKFFLQSKVLSQYGVDPARVCVAGDSAGGNLAAAVAQQLLDDPEVKTKLKAQILLYPALQALDLNLPSYRDNDNKPLLPRSLMVRFWSEYFTSDPALREAMASNRHVPAGSERGPSAAIGGYPIELWGSVPVLPAGFGWGPAWGIASRGHPACGARSAGRQRARSASAKCCSNHRAAAGTPSSGVYYG